MAERRTPGWIAFAAGAVAMLVLVLLWWAWRESTEAADTVGAFVKDAEVVAPDIEPLRIPPAPPIPDSPVPAPR